MTLSPTRGSVHSLDGDEHRHRKATFVDVAYEDAGRPARGSLTGGPLATAFAQEIRRTAPFVPMLPGRAIADIELDGERVAAGGRLVLDILGTDTDARSWERAEEFDPERFVGVADYEAIAAFVPTAAPASRPDTGARARSSPSPASPAPSPPSAAPASTSWARAST